MLRALLLLLFLVTPAFAANSEQASGLQFTRPAGWERTVDEDTHTVVLMPPTGQASATFLVGQDIAGAPDAWHSELWARLSEEMTIELPPTKGQRGAFLVTWTAVAKADGTQAWVCLYSAVKNGRGEGVVFFADSEGPFRTYLTTVHRMVDTITFAKTSVASPATPAQASASSPVSSTGGGTVPELRYEPPANFYRSASVDPEQYASNEVNASLEVYPFRAVTGDIQQLFQYTLLRDWIHPQYREENVTGAPIFTSETIPGAQTVVTAQFTESRVGLPRPHLRILILSGGRAALVDATANSPFSWQRVESVIRATLASLRVVTSSSPQPTVAGSPGPAGKMIAGLYIGTKAQYKVNLFRPVGYGDWVPSMHFYLFSADGRVYRSFNFTRLPGGDHSGFDYDEAQRTDPDNTGRYLVQGDQLLIQMSGQTPETITTPLPQGNHLVIYTVGYLRQ